MRNHLQKTFLLCLLAFVGMTASAYDCEVDGIYYYLNANEKTARVTSNTPTRYSGIVNIPNEIEYGGITYTVTEITYLAFYGCYSLTSVNIPNSVITIDQYAFQSCNLTSINIPNSVTTIGYGAFYGCTNLNHVIIEDGESILNMKYSSSTKGIFENCPIRTLYVGRTLSYTNGYSPFRANKTIKELTIGDYVTSIGNYAFQNCSSLTSLTLSNNVISIGDYAFYGCTGLTSLDIPNGVTSIGNYAFYYCDNLVYIICDNETPPTVFSSSFPYNVIAIVPPSALSKYQSATGWKDTKLNTPFSIIGTTQTTIKLYCTLDFLSDIYVEVNGKKYTPVNDTITITGLSPNQTYQITTSAQYKDYLLKGSISATTNTVNPYISLVSSTNLTLTLKGYYSAGDATVVSTTLAGRTDVDETTVTGLQPGKEYSYTYYVQTADGSTFSTTKSFSTRPITLNASAVTTATSCELKGNYTVIDAVVTDCGFTDYPSQKEVTFTGLDPSKTYKTTFYVDTKDGRVTQDVSYSTKGLTMITSQPKVISAGNVIVAAESNLDDEETNVGFEWRRTDWSDDFASNTGGAYLYNGTMEGYIRNLNTEKLWKYRPYYLSNSGTYYYGDWVGLDPTNTSYFEPTVHTYATINIEGNTVLVKGYALTGTDKVTVQGFKYWKSAAGVRGQDGINTLSAIPSDAMTVEASGQVMTVTLTGLDFNTTYHYAAFVTTSEGETFYGEEQIFSTGDDPTGIKDIYSETNSQEPLTVVARYNIKGERIAAPQKGMNILHMSDGSTRKIMVK